MTVTCRLRRVRSGITRAGLMITAAACVSLMASAPANADTTYYVTVDASASYDQYPDFQTLVSPQMPPGAYLTGNVSCSDVYAPGSNFQDEPIVPFLDAGTYQFDTSTCSSDPNNPLTLEGASGNIEILGGVYNVIPDPTDIVATAVEAGSSTSPTSVTFVAEVNNDALEESPIPGQTVSFRFETATANVYTDACSATTTSDGDGHAYATCTITGTAAQALATGTGVWAADFAGTADYEASESDGQLPAGTSTTTAAANFQTLINTDGVSVVQVIEPPGCATQQATGSDAGDLLNFSLYGFSCAQTSLFHTIFGAIFGGPVQAGLTAGISIARAVITANGNQAIAARQQQQGQVADQKPPNNDVSDDVDEDIGFNTANTADPVETLETIDEVIEGMEAAADLFEL